MKHGISKKAGIQAKKTFLQRLQEDKWYLLFILPAIAYLIAFVYRPMYGIVMAFQEYKIGDPFLAFDGSVEWVGFKQFIEFFNSPFFSRTLLNTLRLSLETLILGCWVPMAVALLLNEIRVSIFKRTFQTVYYMPYFISTVVVVAIVMLLCGTNGPFSLLSQSTGGSAQNYLNEPKYFDFIYVISGIWQTFGYSSILYMAAIAGINPNLYEAAMMDGANRWSRMWNITLPCLLPTFITILILNIGSILGSDSEKILLLYNSFTMDKADVIGTYIYRIGLVGSRYSYTTAVGLFMNVLSFVLVFVANKISQKLTDYSLW